MSGRSALARTIALVVALAAVSIGVRPARALNIVASYDTSITNMAQGSTVMSTINAAIAQYNTKIIDNLTVNITFARMYSGLGGSNKTRWRLNYWSYLATLRNTASSFDDALALNQLPDGTNPVTGSDSILVANALARTLGLITGAQPEPDGAVDDDITVLRRSPSDPASRTDDPVEIRRSIRAAAARAAARTAASPAGAQASNPDGTITINLSSCNLGTGPTPADRYSLTAVAMHEIDEVLGSSSGLNNYANGSALPTSPDPEDLFRFKVDGTRSFSTALNDSSYFSLDGVNRLVRFNQNANGDYSDWWSPAGHPVARIQDAFGTLGADPTMQEEWRMLDAIGWSYASPAVWVDFSYTGTIQAGFYPFPYKTLSGGVAAAPVGGLVIVNNGGITGERPTITKAVGVASIKGVATVGQ